MDILQFINENGVLCSGIFTLITAIVSALVTALIKSIIDQKNAKKDTVKALQKELNDVKAELEKYTSIEIAESSINKGNGAVYTETLPTGETRHICGYCWEKDHVKLPIVVELCYDEYEQQNYYSGFCQVCKSRCIENVNPEVRIRTINNSADTSHVI